MSRRSPPSQTCGPRGFVRSALVGLRCPADVLGKLARHCSPKAPSLQPPRTHCGRPVYGCQTACVSHSKRTRWVCGQLNVCMICGWLLAFCLSLVAWRLQVKAGCLKLVGCWSLAFQWQCSDSDGRLCGPSCRRASRLCVCACVCVC